MIILGTIYCQHLFLCMQPPRIFAPNFVDSAPKFIGYESQRAGIYTPNQLQAFWDNILHSDASKAVLTKISREVLMGRQTRRKTWKTRRKG